MTQDIIGNDDIWIDPDDAPELTDAFFERADEYIGIRVINRDKPKADADQEPGNPSGRCR